MSRLLSKAAPLARAAVRPSALPAAPRAAVQVPRRHMNLAWPHLENVPKPNEETEFVHAKDQVWGLVGCAVVMGYAAFVVAGEPAHEEAHPYYQPPYNFVKRSMENGAQWWPGRHCQLFEFNCFAQAYKEADELMHQKERESFSGSRD